MKTEGICEGGIIIDGTTIHHTFHVVKDNTLSISTDGIIGADLFRKCGAEINFKNSTIKVLSPTHDITNESKMKN